MTNPPTLREILAEEHPALDDCPRCGERAYDWTCRACGFLEEPPAAGDVRCPTCGEPWGRSEPDEDYGTAERRIAKTGRCPSCPRPSILADYVRRYDPCL